MSSVCLHACTVDFEGDALASGNEVNIGIIKRIVTRRQHKSVKDLTRNTRLRESGPQIREVMCTWHQPIHIRIKVFG
jgi:hypothetical protein